MPVLSATEDSSGNVSVSNPILAMDVRSRMGISLLASVVVVFFKGEAALLFFTTVSTLYALSIGRWRLLGVCYLAVGVMWLLSIGFVLLLHSISEAFPLSGLTKILIPFLRSLIMLNTVLVLALTSRVQTLLAALKGLHLPMWLYIPTVVVIRFIPDFIRDIQQINETMRIRGYALNPVFLLQHPVLTVRLMIAPMLFRALRSADELAIAAELKGIRHDRKMVSYKPNTFGRCDAIALLTVTAVIAVGVILEITLYSAATGRMM